MWIAKKIVSEIIYKEMKKTVWEHYQVCETGDEQGKIFSDWNYYSEVIHCFPLWSFEKTAVLSRQKGVLEIITVADSGEECSATVVALGFSDGSNRKVYKTKILMIPSAPMSSNPYRQSLKVVLEETTNLTMNRFSTSTVPFGTSSWVLK